MEGSNLEQLREVERILETLNTTLKTTGKGLNDLGLPENLVTELSKLQRTLSRVESGADKANKGFGELSDTILGLKDAHKYIKDLGDDFDGVRKATEEVTKAQEKLNKARNDKTQNYGDLERLEKELEVVKAIHEHTKKTAKEDKKLRSLTNVKDGKLGTSWDRKKAQYDYAKANVKELWHAAKTGDANKIRGIGGSMKNVSGGATKLGKAGSFLSDAAGMIGRLGPAIGGAIAAVALISKKAIELNSFRTANVNSYYDVGGANTVGNAGGDPTFGSGDQDGAGGFAARQYAYNNFRYNKAIKYGLDAGEAHQVMSGITSSGMSMEGLMSQSTAGHNRANRNIGAEFGKPGWNSSKTVADGGGDYEKLDDIYGSLNEGSRSLGMQMEELGLDFGDLTVTFGSSLENLTGFFDSAAVGAQRAGWMGRDYLKTLKQSAGYYKILMGDQARLTTMLGKVSSLTGSSVNGIKEMFDSITKDQGEKSYEEGMGRAGLLMATGGYGSMMEDQIKEQQAKVDSNTSNEKERAQARANITQLKWMRDNGALGATAFANNSEFGGRAVSASQLKLLKTTMGEGAEGALYAGSEGALGLLAGTGMSQDAAKAYSGMLKALGGTAAEGKASIEKSGTSSLLDKYDLAKDDKERETILTLLEDITGGKSASASIRATGGTGNLRAGKSSIDDLIKITSAGGDPMKRLDEAGIKTTEGITDELTGVEKKWNYTKDQVKFWSSEQNFAKLAAQGIDQLVDIAGDTLRFMQNGSDKNGIIAEKEGSLEATRSAIELAMGKETKEEQAAVFDAAGLRMPDYLANKSDGMIDKDRAREKIKQLSDILETSKRLTGDKAIDYLDSVNIEKIAPKKDEDKFVYEVDNIGRTTGYHVKSSRDSALYGDNLSSDTSGGVGMLSSLVGEQAKLPYQVMQNGVANSTSTIAGQSAQALNVQFSNNPLSTTYLNEIGVVVGKVVDARLATAAVVGQAKKGGPQGG